MANSSFKDIWLTAGKEVGIQVSTFSDAQFDNDAQLTAPALKLKMFINKCNKMLIRHLNKNFTQRLFTFNTADGVAVYPLDLTTQLEGILYHSVRCNTTGANRPLQHMAYNLFRETYTDLTTVNSGKPIYWTDLISGAAVGNTRENSIRLTPIPDDIYEIEYAAKLVAENLITHDQTILWPVETEDVLITWAGAMLENKLGVDKNLDDYAQMALDDVRAWYERPIDKKLAVRMGVRVTDGLGDTSGYDNQNFTRGW